MVEISMLSLDKMTGQTFQSRTVENAPRGPDASGLFRPCAMTDAGGAHESDGSDEGLETGIAEALAPDVVLKEPPQFAVFLLNDDFTTMEFVVEVLQRFFRKTAEEAVEITMKVHHEGRGVAGVYSHQIAETKAAQVVDYARSRQFPLQAAIEPV